MSWVRIVDLDAIPKLGARVLATGDGQHIALFRTSDDRVFALEDKCPHRAGPLSQGIVHGHCVTCPLHDWVIDLETGEATGADEGSTRAFAVRVIDRIVYMSAAGAVDAPQVAGSEQVRAVCE